MSAFDYSGLGLTKLIPANTGEGGGGVLPTGDKDDPLFVVSVVPSYVPTAFYDSPTGLPLMAQIRCVNGEIETPYLLGYINSDGEFTVSTGNSVGTNPVAAPAPKYQLLGNFGYDVMAPVGGGSVTVTAQDIIDAAVTAGAQLFYAETGQSRTALPDDFIIRIDVDLKPVGGHGNIAGVQQTSTTSDARIVRGGGVYDVDPGGSGAAGLLPDANGFYPQADFRELIVAEGSIVTIAVDLSHVPESGVPTFF